MKISAFQQPENVGIKGHFYCAFDPNTRQIQLTVEAASENEAQHRMATVAHLIGVEKADKFFFVILEEAPHGVPTVLKCYFAVPKVGMREAAIIPSAQTFRKLIAS